MKIIVVLSLCLSLSFLGFSQNNTTTPKSTISNKSNGQQNNNTGTGTQKIYNSKKTTNNKTTINNDKHAEIYNGPVFKDSSKQENHYYGPPQRHATKEDIDEIIKAFPEKDSAITIISCQEKECRVFANEIYNILLKLGYKNISPGEGRYMGPGQEKRISVTKRQRGPMAGMRFIYVNPS